MGRCTDRAGIQFRMLNTSKGPAVRSPRAQCDRRRYNAAVCAEVAAQPGLEVITGEAIGLTVRTDDDATRRVRGVEVDGHGRVEAPAVVLTTGTFLGGRLFAGDWVESGGRYGEAGAPRMSRALAALGLRLGRHKTGTPPRLDQRSIDFSRLEVQPGDDPPQPFSFSTERLDLDQLVCWTTRTTPATHAIIAAHADRSPMVQGRIVGSGPRYCPSVEDKVLRYPDKGEHLVFLEPEGRDVDEIYPNGLSTSLPPEVQLEFLRTIPGLEEVAILRHGYAVEYDHLQTDQLRADLHVADVRGLFAAGQINGTSGYEEAAGQGLIAGVNAARFARGEEPIVLDRATAYIGVMVDDLCRVNPAEPYRMFTSRAEFRLRLRSDNADRRLADIAHRAGLVDDDARARVRRKETAIAEAVAWLGATRRDGRTLDQWLRRPETGVADVVAAEPEFAARGLSPAELAEVEAEVKYAGYIERQDREVERLRRMESKRFPAGFRFDAVDGLSTEAGQALTARQPLTVGEASRVPGVRATDLNLLLTKLAEGGRGNASARDPSEARASARAADLSPRT